MRRRIPGQSMVEMALVLPFLLFIVLGIIEIAYYIYTYTELENATRRASERASKTPPLRRRRIQMIRVTNAHNSPNSKRSKVCI